MTPRQALQALDDETCGGASEAAIAVLTALVERHEKLVLTEGEAGAVEAMKEMVAEPGGWTHGELIDAIKDALWVIDRAYQEPQP